MKSNLNRRLVSQSDEEVMLSFQSGNEYAFNELVKRYSERLFHYIYRFVKSTEDTEDILQEVFIRLYRNRNSYTNIARFSTWLFTIANNLTRTHYRKNSRYVTWSIDASVEEDSTPIQLKADLCFSPEHIADSRMALDKIKDALCNLPDEYSQLLIMREIHEMTYQEISDSVGLPMGTVKSRINRGRAKLQLVCRDLYRENVVFAT
jgi:RNA polymerase sigma-70 factor (ECF subfamily)